MTRLLPSLLWFSLVFGLACEKPASPNCHWNPDEPTCQAACRADPALPHCAANDAGAEPDTLPDTFTLDTIPPTSCIQTCGARAPHCDEATAECVECLTSLDCADSGQRICDDGDCVECVDSTHCTTAEAAGCSDHGTCGNCFNRGDCRGVVDAEGEALDACIHTRPGDGMGGHCEAMPERWVLSPDDEGYCWPVLGGSCDCTPLDYSCDWIPCNVLGPIGFCDHHPADFVDIIDEHGCPGLMIVPSGYFCEW